MPVAPVQDLDELSKDMLTLKDIATFFGVSTETARKISRMPGFPLFAHERTLRIPRPAFLRWLDQQTGVDVRDE